MRYGRGGGERTEGLARPSPGRRLEGGNGLETMVKASMAT